MTGKDKMIEDNCPSDIGLDDIGDTECLNQLATHILEDTRRKECWKQALEKEY